MQFPKKVYVEKRLILFALASLPIILCVLLLFLVPLTQHHEKPPTHTSDITSSPSPKEYPRMLEERQIDTMGQIARLDGIKYLQKNGYIDNSIDVDNLKTSKYLTLRKDGKFQTLVSYNLGGKAINLTSECDQDFLVCKVLHTEFDAPVWSKVESDLRPINCNDYNCEYATQFYLWGFTYDADSRVSKSWIALTKKDSFELDHLDEYAHLSPDIFIYRQPQMFRYLFFQSIVDYDYKLHSLECKNPNLRDFNFKVCEVFESKNKVSEIKLGYDENLLYFTSFHNYENYDPSTEVRERTEGSRIGIDSTLLLFPVTSKPLTHQEAKNSELYIKVVNFADQTLNEKYSMSIKEKCEFYFPDSGREELEYSLTNDIIDTVGVDYTIRLASDRIEIKDIKIEFHFPEYTEGLPTWMFIDLQTHQKYCDFPRE
jgi:hypothetical protein